MRLLATQPATTTRPPVFLRRRTTQLATTTRPTGLARSRTTPPAATTRLRVLAHYLSTQPRTTTPPTDSRRSRTTQPATTTLDWALMPAAISPLGVIILISLIQALPATPTPFVSAHKERRQKHLSLASAQQRLWG